MQFALVDGARAKAEPGASGVCQFCSRRMIPKCGQIVRWHWAHERRHRCDAWWENESDWHRNWKSEFDEHWREVVHIADDGERHIADVKTPDGLIVELQHSSMPVHERDSREAFYGRMIWIVDALPFAKSFNFLSPSPIPRDERFQDIHVIRPASVTPENFRRMGTSRNNAVMIRSKHATKIENAIVYDYSSMGPGNTGYNRSHEVYTDIAAAKSKYWFYEWKRPREAWISSSKQIYLDFGEQELWRMDHFTDARGATFPCVESVIRSDLIRCIKANNFGGIPL